MRTVDLELKPCPFCCWPAMRTGVWGNFIRCSNVACGLNETEIRIERWQARVGANIEKGTMPSDGDWRLSQLAQSEG